jgi:PAS domain S-box-containing protein
VKTSSDAATHDLAFLQGGGAMGELIRAYDWSRNPLGPPVNWSPPLQLAVQLVLNTGHPMCLRWGPQLICIYNDAYGELIGQERHPTALGKPAREVWSEVWHIAGPQLEHVLAGHGVVWTQNALVPMTRNGRSEETYWTYSYSPVRDAAAANGIGGVLVVCSETTAVVLAEKRVADEMHRQRRLFEQAPSFMCILTGPEHVFEFVNDAHRRLFNSDDWIGKPVREAFPDIEGQGFYEALDKVRATGQRAIFNAQPVRFRASGSNLAETRLLDFIYEPITDSTSTVTGILCQGFDVTDAYKAEEALRLSESQLRLATDAADIGLWDVDPVAGTLFWPARVKAMFGISPDVEVTLADFYEGLHPADRDRVAAAFASAIDPDHRRVYDVEYRTVGKEDGIIRWVAAKGRGIFNEQNQCVRVIGTAIDISKRRLTEQRLRELNESLEQRVAEALAEKRLMAELIDTTNAFIQVADLDFRWLAINRASANEFERIFGVRPRVGDSMLDVLADKPEHQQTVKAIWQRALNGETFIEIGQFGDPRFDQRVYEMRFNPLHDTKGSIIGAYQFVYDVTERLQEQARLASAEEQLRQSQKMEAVGQLTGGLAHDFNNLLIGISGSLELLQKRINEGRLSGVERYINAAQGASRRAAALTQRLLAFSRRQTLDPKPTDVNRLVSGMEELIRRTMGPGIEVEIVGAGGLWVTRVDGPQLESALLNLCINARDAMAPDGGRLTIETANKWLDEHAAAERELPPGQYISLCVTDTGTGMTPEIMRRAFDPFFTTKPLGEGTGLGLSMVHGFARQSGGQVRIYSELGKGTTMCLYFPRYLGDASAIEQDPEEISPGAMGETVLVVDDEPTVRMLAVEELTEKGYSVLEAFDGPSALRILETSVNIDLLITDVGLPGGLNGRQVADAARVIRPELKVLFITGYAENAAVGNGYLLPGMQVLTKPFAISDLANRVRNMLDGQR